MSAFWGTLFSITLVASFSAPALRLLAEAHQGQRVASDRGELSQWLHEHAFQSVRRQLGTSFSLLAPPLVGPLSSLISSFSGL